MHHAALVKRGNRLPMNVLSLRPHYQSVLLRLRPYAEDWPDCFARVTEDADGCIQVCFRYEKIEGDVTTYMNQFFRMNIDVQTYALRKDPTRWGVVLAGAAAGAGAGEGAETEAEGGEKKTILRFFFIPMWVHVRGLVDLGVAAPGDPARWRPETKEPPLLSGRVPFGPTTNGGDTITTHVRTLSRSFKF